MKEFRLKLINRIDEIASSLNEEFIQNGSISENLLKTIFRLYSSARIEQELKNQYFEAAYHPPITGELEFLISRILYHYSKSKELNWKILLRKQENRTSPDIRIISKNKTIAIIEIKANGGWIQPFLSKARYDHDRDRKNAMITNFDPDDFIAKQKKQLEKYQITFNLKPEDIFYFLPTLAAVHRKKDGTTLDDYYKYFSAVSGLPHSNFVLLSSNLYLKLSNNPTIENLCPLMSFENMVDTIRNKTYSCLL